MATAPTPGVGRKKAQAEVSKSIVTLTYDGEQYALAWQNLPMGERLVVRKATGLPFETFTQPLSIDGANVIGEDSLFVLWWLARRAHGDPALSYDTAVGEWDTAKIGGIEVDVPDVKGDDPEA